MSHSSSLRAAAQAATYVTLLSFSVIFGAWVGNQADVWFATSPGFLLLGLCIGAVAGFYNLIRGFNATKPPSSDAQTGPHDPS